MSAVQNPTTAVPQTSSFVQDNTNTTTASKPAKDDSILAKGKRKILVLGKKKDDQAKTSKHDEQEQEPSTMTAATPPTVPALLPSPPLNPSSTDRRPSPRGSPRMYPVGVAASPNRRLNRSSSPGLHSPASSQIFERNVQEPEPSPAIPAHIKTEDHIPPALDASSLAITDDHLNPDEVEIVMHSAHQPASAAVAGSVTDSIHSPSLSQEESFAAFAASHPELSESASNYGSIDTADVRRLSFISFADVVQAEHVENDREAMQYMSLSSTANRSPSPVRSPASSHGFSASPPPSGAASEKGAEIGGGIVPRGARSPGSPTVATTAHGTHSPPLGGELQIETMRQALRRTGSGEFSGVRSQPLSAVSLEDSAADQPPFK